MALAKMRERHILARLQRKWLGALREAPPGNVRAVDMRDVAPAVAGLTLAFLLALCILAGEKKWLRVRRCARIDANKNTKG